MMDNNLNGWRIGVIILFVVMFTIAGWSAPMVVAAHIPQDYIIEMHNFEAQNTTTDADNHYVCIDRVVHRPASADTYTELYMVSDSGKRIVMNTNNVETYFEEGHRQVVPTMSLPESTVEGTYRYVLVTKFQMANGRVERTFTFESDKFEINDSVNMEDNPEEYAESCECRKT